MKENLFSTIKIESIVTIENESILNILKGESKLLRNLYLHHQNRTYIK